MAYSPISFIASNYRDYKYQWLKAYEPGTTTPKVMATDSTAATTIAKAQLNINGFIVTAGSALFIPFIDGAYDLWLFPTEAQADANDTSSALRLADNITGVSFSTITERLVNDLSQAYEFSTYALMRDSDILFPNNKIIKTKEYELSKGGGAEYSKISGVGTANGYKITASTVTDSSFVLRVDYTTNVRKWGANSTGNAAFITGAFQAALDSPATVITCNTEDTYTVDSLWFRKSNYKTLNLNGCELIDNSNAVTRTWAVINVINSDSGLLYTDPKELYLRPVLWTPSINVVVNGGIINYANAVSLVSANYNMIQVNLGINCEVNNTTLSNNFITIGQPDEASRGGAVVFRGECRNCTASNNNIAIVRQHGFAHVNRYLAGDFTPASGEAGTATYASNAEISGLLRCQNTTYKNNIVDSAYNYAFDTHSYDGVTTITENNRVVNCGSFFKNQTGRTVATNNYVKNMVGNPDLSASFWCGWLSGFLEGNYFPDVTSVVSDNTFINLKDKFRIDHAVDMDGNEFLSQDGFILTGLRGIFSQSSASTSTIENNKFYETWAGGNYIEEIATSPDSNQQIDVTNNKFRIFNTQVGSAQARILNMNGTEVFNCVNNSYVEKNSASTAFLIFCLIEGMSGARISQNTVVKASGQPSALAWNVTAGMTKNMATENIGIGCTIDGTFDVKANNLLV